MYIVRKKAGRRDPCVVESLLVNAGGREVGGLEQYLDVVVPFGGNDGQPVKFSHRVVLFDRETQLLGVKLPRPRLIVYHQAGQPYLHLIFPPDRSSRTVPRQPQRPHSYTV